MKKVSFIIVFSLIFLTAKATHNRAGEILYQRIAPYTSVVGTVTLDVYKYSITVIRYVDFGSNVANRCVDTVYFGDGTKGIANLTNGTPSFTCSCANSAPCNVFITNDPNYVVKKNVFIIEHTYPGPGNYLITSVDPNRNQGVINIPNSVNQIMYLESLLIINPNTGINSSPVSANPPLGRGGLINCFSYNSVSTDADGDSLSYDLNPSRGVNGQTLPGFTFPTFGASGHFNIHNSTGFLSWCVPQSGGEYNFMIAVREWRKNSNGVYQLNGYVLREMQVVITNGYTSLNENKELADLTLIAPNPFTNKLDIEFKKPTKDTYVIQLYAIDGKEAVSQKQTITEGKISFDTESLPAGIYLIRVNNGQEVLHKKLVKH
jgi:hypothetical protein